MNFRGVFVSCLAALVPGVAIAALTPEQIDKLPPPASRGIDFSKDIKPIFDASCSKCHGRGKAKGGFRLDTRETFLKDADSGPVVEVGKSGESLLIDAVSGLDPDLVMPQKGSRLTPGQVGLLRAWIDQGLKWDAGVTFAREPHRNLKPRRPEIPPASAGLNLPVDRFVWRYFKHIGFEPPAPVDDRTFARRVYLDAVGLLPGVDELDAFLKDGRPDKRERLVEALLSDSTRYAQHWLTFWNDLLRNDYRGTGYIDGGREQITAWLYKALKDDMPYDQFVSELVNPGKDGPRGFTKGIVWRGAVNASQRPPIQAAQNISQVFLGVNLKCASCHDSFIDDWQLADAYGMAGIYSDERLELVRCDKPLGTHAPVKFLFEEIGTIDDNASKEERIARLAELMTDPANGRVPRTLVNRLWARFMGRGLVEPVDVMQNVAWDPDLLDWLAEDLVRHGYDLKRTMTQILTSRAYQLPAVDLGGDTAKDIAFHGPIVRRLTAEQFRDALGQLTGVWYDRPEGGIDNLLFEKGRSIAPPVTAFWIWSDPHAAEGVPPQTVYFRKSFDLDTVPGEAVAVVQADNTCRLWVNGRVARGENDTPWNESSVVNIRPFLRKGANTLAAEVTNGGEGPNPAGFLLYARLRGQAPAGAEAGTTAARILDFATDATWRVGTNRVDGWEKRDFKEEDWSAAQVLGPPGMEPWSTGPQFAATVSGHTIYGQVRSSLVAADPLSVAMGRPNREQVMSARSYTATTIQMLELTNGETLADVLKKGAEELMRGAPAAPAIVDRVFERGLCRAPSREEAAMASELIGKEPAKDGVEDLLWSVAMLPEFQLIY